MKFSFYDKLKFHPNFTRRETLMKIIISETIISLPPYISTTWSQIKSIRSELSLNQELLLVLTLQDDSKIKIPHLSEQVIHSIFEAHLKFLENISYKSPQLNVSQASQMFALPMKMLGQMDGITSFLQHNMAQKDMPDLPKEIVGKIKEMTRHLKGEELQFLPKPEPHCNCMHCQLAKAMHQDHTSIIEEEEEIVSEQDLQFKTWDIEQNGNKLFIVKNPLDHLEQYSVYLGEPIGCTCGQKNCEHIKAVLQS